MLPRWQASPTCRPIWHDAASLVVTARRRPKSLSRSAAAAQFPSLAFDRPTAAPHRAGRGRQKSNLWIGERLVRPEQRAAGIGGVCLMAVLALVPSASRGQQPQDQPDGTKADVMFVLDVTASMKFAIDGVESGLERI